jgi:hypothetical protein
MQSATAMPGDNVIGNSNGYEVLRLAGSSLQWIRERILNS